MVSVVISTTESATRYTTVATGSLPESADVRILPSASRTASGLPSPSASLRRGDFLTMVAFSGTGCVAWITPDSVVPVDAGLCSAVAVSGSVTPVLLVPVPSVDAVVSFGSMTMNIPPPVSWSLSCVAAETSPPTVPRCAIIPPSITQETTSRPASTATSAINAARLPLPEPDGAAAGGAYTYPCPPVGVV